MILALILWSIKKRFPLSYVKGLIFINDKINSRRIRKNISGNIPAILRISIIALLCMLTASYISAQEQVRLYDVIYKGQTIGNMSFYQKRSGHDIYMKMNSKVKVGSLISIVVETEEASAFKNGKLVYSSVKRSVNGKEKAYKITKAEGDAYYRSEEKRKNVMYNVPIAYNLHLLYLAEPVNIQKVYSDNFQEFLLIQKIADHKYKIELPDGNYNYYSFKNGICNDVEVNHSMYSLKLQLKKDPG